MFDRKNGVKIPSFEVVLTDGDGKFYAAALSQGHPGEPYSFDFKFRQSEFGEGANGQTVNACIAGVNVNGDVWRFLEMHDKFSELHAVLSSKDGVQLLADFQSEFDDIESDEDQKELWDQMLSDNGIKAKQQALRQRI